MDVDQEPPCHDAPIPDFLDVGPSIIPNAPDTPHHASCDLTNKDMGMENAVTASCADVDLTDADIAASEIPMTSLAKGPISNQLLLLGLHVDLTHRFTICRPCAQAIPFDHTHSHLLENHAPSRHIIPSKEEVTHMLVQLHADHCLEPSLEPILPISRVPIINTYRCKLAACTSIFLFSDRRQFNEHCQLSHADIPARDRLHSVVKLVAWSQHVYLVKVTDVLVSLTSAGSLVDKIEAALASSDFYALPDVFQQPSNQQTKGVIFAQLGWDCLLVNVNIHSLCTTVAFLKESEAVYLKLALAVKLYYKSASTFITNLPMFTAQAVLSTGKMGSQPFKPLQEKSTLKKYS